MDFACKQIEAKDIIKCAFGLTKAELNILDKLISLDGKETTAADIGNMLALDHTTAQRGLKKLHLRGALKRTQTNLSGGGYVYSYSAERSSVRAALRNAVRAWTVRVENEIEKI